jgi:hypothetical protein
LTAKVNQVRVTWVAIQTLLVSQVIARAGVVSLSAHSGVTLGSLANRICKWCGGWTFDPPPPIEIRKTRSQARFLRRPIFRHQYNMLSITKLLKDFLGHLNTVYIINGVNRWLWLHKVVWPYHSAIRSKRSLGLWLGCGSIPSDFWNHDSFDCSKVYATNWLSTHHNQWPWKCCSRKHTVSCITYAHCGSHSWKNCFSEEMLLRNIAKNSWDSGARLPLECRHSDNRGTQLHDWRKHRVERSSIYFSRGS